MFLEAEDSEPVESDDTVAVNIATKTNSLGSKVGAFIAKHPFIITYAVFSVGYATGRSVGDRFDEDNKNE